MKISEIKGRITNPKQIGTEGKTKFSLATSQKEKGDFVTYWVEVITENFNPDWEKQIAFIKGDGRWGKWKTKEGVEKITLTVFAEEITVQEKQVNFHNPTSFAEDAQTEKVADFDF